MTNPFQQATRATIPVKIGLVGPSGSGKTYTALRIAHGIAGADGKVALIDTEHGSASLYADEFMFDVVNMPPPYAPARFAAGIAAASEAGYAVLVVDGISPAWNGPGGVMEIVDQNAKGGNNWSGWAKGTPAHQQLIQAILAAPMHLICTMRSKTAWVLGEKNKPEKVGLEPVQRDGMDYEFSVVGELDLEHRLHVTKSRLRGVAVGEFVETPTEEFGRLLFTASRGDSRSEAGVPQPASPKPESAGSDAPSGNESSKSPRPATPEPAPASPVAEPDEDETARAHAQKSTLDVKDPDHKVITAAQRRLLFKTAGPDGKGMTGEQLRDCVEAVTGSRSLTEMRKRHMDAVLLAIENYDLAAMGANPP